MYYWFVLDASSKRSLHSLSRYELFFWGFSWRIWALFHCGLMQNLIWMNFRNENYEIALVFYSVILGFKWGGYSNASLKLRINISADECLNMSTEQYSVHLKCLKSTVPMELTATLSSISHIMTHPVNVLHSCLWLFVCLMKLFFFYISENVWKKTYFYCETKFSRAKLAVFVPIQITLNCKF